jgi:hypothetical protein
VFLARQQHPEDVFDESTSSERTTEIQAEVLDAILPNLPNPVAVETSKTDGDGQAIHEDCYVLKVRLEQASKDGHQA